jgi:transcriptional regulator with XRE-family HTH domain
MATPLGDRIREIRQQRQIGQAELARRLGRLPQDVYKWEHGRQVPSNEIPALADALEVRICQLFGRDEAHPVPSEPSPALPVRGSRRLASETPGRIRDMVVAQLTESWGQLPDPEKELLREVAAATERFRERLRAEEGLPGEATPASGH